MTRRDDSKPVENNRGFGITMPGALCERTERRNNTDGSDHKSRPCQNAVQVNLLPSRLTMTDVHASSEHLYTLKKTLKTPQGAVLCLGTTDDGQYLAAGGEGAFSVTTRNYRLSRYGWDHVVEAAARENISRSRWQGTEGSYHRSDLGSRN